ncbi:MAG: hypothetical protein ABI855_03505 [Bacteroidota bacterium]
MQRQIKHTTNEENQSDYLRFFKALTTNINWVNSLLTVLFIGTLILTVVEIDIYRKTIIHWAIPTFIWLLTGLILTPLTSSFLKKYIDTNSFFLQLVFNVVTWGGLLIYGLMATNYYLPTDSSKTITTKIINTGHLAKGKNGCGEPYCEVVINRTVKQLVFPCDFNIEIYNDIDLTIKKGLWGFDIITDKNPTNEKKNAL